jgi:hypothetical protein
VGVGKDEGHKRVLRVPRVPRVQDPAITQPRLVCRSRSLSNTCRESPDINRGMSRARSHVMTGAKNHKELIVCQVAEELRMEVYQLTAQSPASRDGLSRGAAGRRRQARSLDERRTREGESSTALANERSQEPSGVSPQRGGHGTLADTLRGTAPTAWPPEPAEPVEPVELTVPPLCLLSPSGPADPRRRTPCR